MEEQCAAFVSVPVCFALFLRKKLLSSIYSITLFLVLLEEIYTFIIKI